MLFDYATLRLYINFFQPSLKLKSKIRDGAKVTKKYDKAKTPYQRLLISINISEEIKIKLRTQYEQLDPILLLKNLQLLQDKFWKYAWKEPIQSASTNINEDSLIPKTTTNPIHESSTIAPIIRKRQFPCTL